MEEIKKAIMEGVSSLPKVGVGRTMTPTTSAILMLVLSIGAKEKGEITMSGGKNTEKQEEKKIELYNVSQINGLTLTS